MKLHTSKWFVYAVIAAFGLLMALFIVLSVNNYIALRAKWQEKKAIEKGKEYKQVSDSITTAVIKTLDSVLHKKEADSTKLVTEKKLLQTKYSIQIKIYEKKLADIDTMDNRSIDSAFSTRKMLSDSSATLW